MKLLLREPEYFYLPQKDARKLSNEQFFAIIFFMQLPKILTDPDPFLRRKGTEIAPANIISKKIQNLIKTMRDVLNVSDDGVGLAAPQIGEAVRIFLVSEEVLAIDRGEDIESDERSRYHPPMAGLRDRQATPAQRAKLGTGQTSDKKKIWPAIVFINPVIKKFSVKKTDMVEGCLSVPGIYGMVRRPEKIDVEWYDEHGKKNFRGCSKFFARVIQHETDHIDGILFIDKMHREVTLGKEKARL